MCKNCDAPDQEKFRRSRPWLLRSLVLLIAFGGTAVLLLGSRPSPSIVPRVVPQIKSAVTAGASRTSPPSWTPPEETDTWNLMLVNPWNPLPEHYSIDLISLRSGQSVDRRCADALEAMMADCQAAGLSPLICSSYRTQATQQGLYNAQIQDLIAQGLSSEEAEKQAATMVALPGTSEHQLGLAVDIVDSEYQILENSQENTPVQRWLMEHCWEYGFILRYPKEKTPLTGIIYEPWHYRYVGKEAAEEISKAGICLEEYLGAIPASPD